VPPSPQDHQCTDYITLVPERKEGKTEKNKRKWKGRKKEQEKLCERKKEKYELEEKVEFALFMQLLQNNTDNV
jgi:hypothetical protein